MSNENNEEIELFDYMDEESESRKIPVNKKEKTGVLNVRDLVNVGLFSVLIFIATFLSGLEELRQQ